ncbi:MAG: hypothetical protein KBC15_04220 [Candidatus Levybacteria bacterium]|nr:hypothetical protein [Candidatus Levybacteria bacterium]
MSEIKDLEERISKIEKRNKSVEAEKAWETSFTRKIAIIIFTYFTIALYLKFIVGIDPWINAIVPAIGFLLSTQSLPFVKSVWQKYLFQTK